MDGPQLCIAQDPQSTKEIPMRWLFGLSLSALLAGAVIFVLSVRLIPPTNIHAAIAIALDEQAIDYQQVQMQQGGCVPAPEHCLAYVAEVMIVNGYRHSGRVECVRLGVGCRLWAPSLGMHGAPLPDLETSHWGWLQAIERAWQRITTWVNKHFW
jgi:hypothetical protein